MHSLPVFLRITGRPVILVGGGDAADAKRRLIERAGGIIIDETDDISATARIAFVALDGDAADTAAARLKLRGLLVNVVDRPELCDFTTPAMVDRDPVLIAVGTGGASAGLAKMVRQRIESLLPERVGGLASALAAARGAIRARWPDGRARRAAIDTALSPGGMLDPLADQPADAVARWLEHAGDDGGQGRLERVALHSFDPDDLTLRAARLLGIADAVWHCGDVPEPILARARADAERHIAPVAPPAPASGIIVWLELAA